MPSRTDRRGFLVIVASGTLGVAGCSSDRDENGNGTQSAGNGDGEYDAGTIVDQQISDLRDWRVNLVQGQEITVEVAGLTDGDMLQFQVGDGTEFVHTRRFYEDGDDRYEAESDGRHQIQLHPKRDDPPVNQEVEVGVTVKVSEP